MKTARYLLSALLIFGTVWGALDYFAQRDKWINPSSMAPQPKRWQEIGRKAMLDESWVMEGQTGWYVPGQGGNSNGLRFWLEGSFASSDPQIRMIVLDAPNWQKVQAGFPPLASESASPDEQFKLAASPAGYYFGFFRVPQASADMPTSGASLALTLLKRYEDAHPAPARMTAHVELVAESLCTIAEAQREREAFEKGVSGQVGR